VTEPHECARERTNRDSRDIIMGKYSIVINRFKVASRRNIESFALELLSHAYTEDEGWGYYDVVRKNDLIYSILQKRTPVYYSVWNEEQQQLERQLIQVIREVPFEMDFSKGFLVAEGTNAQMNLVKQCFRQSFWGELVYESLDFIPYDYVSMFSKDGILSSINEITINDFQYEGILLGRYIAHMTSPIDIEEKLAEHSKNIVRARMSIIMGGEQCEISVNNHNVLSVVCSDGVKSEFIDYLKRIF